MAEDVINVYRGQDGDVDYDNPVAVMAPGDVQVEIDGQALPPDTTWHYVRRRKRGCCGLESASSPACIVHIGSNNEMLFASPNPPVDLWAEVISGGRIRLRWRYSRAGQEVEPSGFVVYMDSRGIPTSTLNYYRNMFSAGWFPLTISPSRWLMTAGWFGPSGRNIDYNTPVGLLAHSGIEFEWISPAINNDQVYRFAVRSYSIGQGISRNADCVTAVADSLGPAAITAVMADIV